MVAFNDLEGPSAHSSVLCPVHTCRNGPFLSVPSLFLHLHISLHLSFSCGEYFLSLFISKAGQGVWQDCILDA